MARRASAQGVISWKSLSPLHDLHIHITAVLMDVIWPYISKKVYILQSKSSSQLNYYKIDKYILFHIS